MSDDQLPAITRQKLAVPGRSRRNAVTGKLRTALDLMVWEALERKEAAERAGLVDRSVRDALRKPHVVAYYNSELAALRTSKRAKNYHRLDTIAADSQNDMAKVAAIKTMEAIADVAEQHVRPGDTQSPGVVIVIQQAAADQGFDRPIQPVITIQPEHAHQPPVQDFIVP